MATVPNILSEPIRVADLPLPPDVAESVARYCRSGKFTRSEQIAIEDDARLSHHYAGHYVIATAGPQGLQIHAIDLENPDEIHDLHQRLRAQGYRHVLSLYPYSDDEPNGGIVTLNAIS